MPRSEVPVWLPLLFLVAGHTAEAGVLLTQSRLLRGAVDAAELLEGGLGPGLSAQSLPVGKVAGETPTRIGEAQGLGEAGPVGLSLEEDWLAEALFQDIAEEHAALYGKVLEVKLSNDSQDVYLDKEVPTQGTVRKAPKGVSALVSVSVSPGGDTSF